MKPFLSAFTETFPSVPPCWFMRQAGRYLPEYRALREQSGDFLHMCYTPQIATEITLQPIRRYRMDAAIIFSDILVIPHALGLNLHFEKGHGPRLQTIYSLQDMDALSLEPMQEFLKPVYQALRQTKASLSEDTALIGFAGAPWTLFCYMLDGHGKEDFIQARSAIYSQPELTRRLIALLTEAIIQHLSLQIEAGADAVQLFDSWASYVPSGMRETLVYEPTRQIVTALKQRFSHIPVICFPRAIGEADYVRFAAYVKPDGLSIDQHTDIAALAHQLPTGITLQGNIDPLLLIAGGEALRKEVTELKHRMKNRRFILNLGHGVLPSTPPEHMTLLINTLKDETA